MTKLRAFIPVSRSVISCRRSFHRLRLLPAVGIRVTGTVRENLDAMKLLPSKKLGQNFLTDTNMSAWIADQLEAGPDDCVIEVGPGLGALTRHLVGRVRKIVLVEKDYRLAGRLKEQFADDASVEVHTMDACEFDHRALYAEGPVKFIGNLPYSAAGQIMRNLLDHPTPVANAVLMLQKEVAERLVAKPRTKMFGVLTLQHAQRWQVDFLKTVPPQLFFPVPIIDSAVVKFSPLEADALPVFDRKRFSQLVKMGFSQRRKQLRKLLPETPISWVEVADQLGISDTARAEELDLPTWIALTRIFDGLSDSVSDRGQSDDEVFDVVDDKDEVVRQERRAVVHAEGLCHRAIHIFAFNRAGELFLQKRSHLKDTMPLRWDSSASGHVDSGETYLQSALREVEEELGVQLAEEDLEFVAKLPPIAETGFEFVSLYRTEIKPSKVRLPAAEVDTGEFFSMEQVRTWAGQRPQDFAPGFLECLRALEVEDVGSGLA